VSHASALSHAHPHAVVELIRSAPAKDVLRYGTQTPQKHHDDMVMPSLPPAAATMEQSDVEREEDLDRMLTQLALADDACLMPLLAHILP
jgi:hypothetical protein